MFEMPTSAIQSDKNMKASLTEPTDKRDQFIDFIEIQLDSVIEVTILSRAHL